MGEKQIHSFLKLLDSIKKGNIDIEAVKHGKLKLILTDYESQKEIFNLFLEMFEKISEQRIVAYSRDINNRQCEVYIHL
ncbi:MAG: hypothetical protein ACTSQY_10695 [Candidatus Odinarchaeia archaeon]